MIYEWKNTKTGEIVTVERSLADYQVPPDESGDWERILSGFAAKVTGGTSPARGSISYGRKK